MLIVLFLIGTKQRVPFCRLKTPGRFSLLPPPSQLLRARHRAIFVDAILRVCTVIRQASDVVCWVIDHTKYTVYKVAYTLRIGTYSCRPLLPFVVQGKIPSCDPYCTSAARI